MVINEDIGNYIKLKDPIQYTEEDALFVFCNQDIGDYPFNFVMYLYNLLMVEEHDEEETEFIENTSWDAEPFPLYGFKAKAVRGLGDFEYLERFESSMKGILKVNARELAKVLSSDLTESEESFAVRKGFVFLKDFDYMMYIKFNKGSKVKYNDFLESLLENFKIEFKTVYVNKKDGKLEEYFDKWF